MDHLFYLSFLLYLTIITKTALAQTTNKPIVIVNDEKRFFENECTIKVNERNQLKGINFSENEKSINCSWKHNSKSIFGYMILLKGNGKNECKTINNFNNDKIFDVTFLPTNLSKIDEIIVYSIPTIDVAYNRLKKSLRINVIKELNAPTCDLRVWKNPNEDCTSGEKSKSFNFDFDKYPQRSIDMKLEPENGFYCIQIKPTQLPSFSSQNFTLKELDNFPDPNCTYDAPIESWNLSITTKLDQANSSVEVILDLSNSERYTCLETFEMSLLVNTTNCQTRDSETKKIITGPNLKTTFMDLTYGNYCVRVHPLCKACHVENLYRFSKIFQSVPPRVDDIQTSVAPTTDFLLIYLAITVCVVVVLLILLGIVVYKCRRKSENNETTNDGNYYVIQSLENVIENIEISSGINRKTKLTLISIVNNQRLKTIIDKLVDILEKNFFCEVFVANSTTLKIVCNRTNLTLTNDAVAHVIKNSDKIVFVKPNIDIESILTPRTDDEAVFINFRQILVSGYPNRWLRQHVAVLDIDIGTESYPVLKDRDVNGYSLPVYFAHLFGFVHDVNGDVMNEYKFNRYWESRNDSSLKDFIELLNQQNSTQSRKSIQM